MRKIIVGAQISLDGVMQAPGGPQEDPSKGFKFGGWAMPYFDAVFGEEIDRVLTNCDLLLGRKTYEIFAAYWPYNLDNPIGEKFQRIHKYVLTHSDEPLAWDNSSKLSCDTAEAVAELKKSDGPDLLIQGSSTLYPPLLSARLIDRLMLIRFPIVLGRGKRLFDGSEAPSTLRLVDHFASKKGVVTSVFEPAGDVRTGTFETKPPSEEELARRKKMKAGNW